MEFIKKHYITILLVLAIIAAAYFRGFRVDFSVKSVPSQETCQSIVSDVKSLQQNVLDIQNVKNRTEGLVPPVVVELPGKIYLSCQGTAYVSDGPVQDVYFFKSATDTETFVAIEGKQAVQEVFAQAVDERVEEETERRQLINIYGSEEKGRLMILMTKIMAMESLGQNTDAEMKEFEYWKKRYYEKFPEEIDTETGDQNPGT